jgi:hypothetical protein
MKHNADPTKRSPEKANRSIAGFAQAQNRLEKGVAEGDVISTKFATKQAQKGKDRYQHQPDIEIPLYDRARNRSVLPKYAEVLGGQLEPFDHFETRVKSSSLTQIVGVTQDSRKLVIGTMMAPPESVEKFVAAMNRGGFSDVPIQRVSIKGYSDADTNPSVTEARLEKGVAEELGEEFDLIETIIENLAKNNGVDAETIWEDLESLSDDELYVFATTTTITESEAWQKANKKDKTDGMSQKAVNSYRRAHPGSKLKTAVTTKPGKLKKGSKASKRRKSYCSRSRGQMKMHSISCAKTPDKAICKARRRWNC